MSQSSIDANGEVELYLNVDQNKLEIMIDVTLRGYRETVKDFPMDFIKSVIIFELEKRIETALTKAKNL